MANSGSSERGMTIALQMFMIFEAITTAWPWIGFLLFIAGMMSIDLGLFNRRAHVIAMREALTWFGIWIGLALVFNLGLVFFHERGIEAGLEFLTGLRWPASGIGLILGSTRSNAVKQMRFSISSWPEKPAYDFDAS